MNDVGAVAEEAGEELDVGDAVDRAVRPVVEAVQRVVPVRLDGEMQQAREGQHEPERNQHPAEKQSQRDREHVSKLRPVGNLAGSERRKRGTLRELVKQCDAACHRERQHQDQRQQLAHRVRELAHRTTVLCFPGAVVDVGRLPGWRSITALVVREGLTDMQRRGVSQLRTLAERRVDVEHRHFADERISAERDATRLNDAGLGPVTVEKSVLAYDRAVSHREEIGADRNMRGKDQRVPADLRAEGAQIQRVDRRAGKQNHRVELHQRLDEPEARVPEAPNANSLRLPASDEHPLQEDRKSAHGEEVGARRNERSQGSCKQARPGTDQVVTSSADEGQHVEIGEHAHELERAT